MVGSVTAPRCCCCLEALCGVTALAVVLVASALLWPPEAPRAVLAADREIDAVAALSATHGCPLHHNDKPPAVLRVQLPPAPTCVTQNDDAADAAGGGVDSTCALPGRGTECEWGI
jgi:hypothetical protein